MTRRLFKTKDGWDVATGWDRMLQHFFLDIYRDCPACDGSGDCEGAICTECKGEAIAYLYDNLSDPSLRQSRGGLSLAHLEQKLMQHLTAYPDSLVEDLRYDFVRNEGNLIVTYSPPVGKAKNG